MGGGGQGGEQETWAPRIGNGIMLQDVALNALLPRLIGQTGQVAGGARQRAASVKFEGVAARGQ